MKLIIIILILFYFLKIYLTTFYLHVKIENKINPIKKIYGSGGIPKIIFRTHDPLYVSLEMYKKCYKKWILYNPDFTHVCYTNRDMDKFIGKYYSGPVNDAYKKVRPGAYKADLWRLCILNKFGGIYIDAFATPYKSIISMLDKCMSGKTFISVLDCNDAGGGIHNGVIISVPNHPFLIQAINDIVYNIENNYYGESSLAVTGPLALSKSIKKVSNITKHTYGWNNKNGNYPYYLYKLFWGPYQNVYKGGIKILSKYFSFLVYLYRKMNKKSYTYMWENRKIY